MDDSRKANPLHSPRLFLKFWLEAFKEALGKGWLMSGIASAVIPDLLVVIGKAPLLAQVAFFTWISENPNLARLYCVAIVVLLYLIYAPYRKYKETQIHALESMKRAWERLNAAGEEISQLKAQLDQSKRLEKEKRRRKEFANKLASVMDKGRELASRCADQDASIHPTEEEIGLWTDSVYVELSIGSMGMGTSSIYVARYNAARDTSGMAIIGIHLDRSRDYKFIMSKVDVLGEFIRELMQPS